MLEIFNKRLNASLLYGLERKREREKERKREREKERKRERD
jgi:hypothetical protein